MNSPRFFSGFIIGILWVSAVANASSAATPEAGKPAGKYHVTYMREDIPSFKIPPYTGERYTVMAPDTLDLAERAKLAIHGVTAPTDPVVDHDTYSFTVLYRNPPMMYHAYDVCIAKYYEALPLLRTMSGSTLNDNVDRIWMEGILKSIGPDGLFYFCSEGRPWMASENMYVWAPTFCTPEGKILSTRGRTVPQFAEKWSLGRIMGAMMIYYLRDGNPIWDRGGPPHGRPPWGTGD